MLNLFSNHRNPRCYYTSDPNPDTHPWDWKHPRWYSDTLRLNPFLYRLLWNVNITCIEHNGWDARLYCKTRDKATRLIIEVNIEEENLILQASIRANLQDTKAPSAKIQARLNMVDDRPWEIGDTENDGYSEDTFESILKFFFGSTLINDVLVPLDGEWQHNIFSEYGLIQTYRKHHVKDYGLWRQYLEEEDACDYFLEECGLSDYQGNPDLMFQTIQELSDVLLRPDSVYPFVELYNRLNIESWQSLRRYTSREEEPRKIRLHPAGTDMSLELNEGRISEMILYDRSNFVIHGQIRVGMNHVHLEVGKSGVGEEIAEHVSDILDKRLLKKIKPGAFLQNWFYHTTAYDHRCGDE
jgi:hypothetical protein